MDDNLPQNCFFCNIVAGDITARRVYEDQISIGILDAQPASLGHVILIPKQHFTVMQQIEDPVLGQLFVAGKKISHALLRTLKGEGISIFIANGTVAGQKAPHVLIHIIPRKEGDGIGLQVPKNKADPQSLEQTRQIVAKKYAEMFGTQEKQKEENENPQEGGPDLQNDRPSHVKSSDGEIMEFNKIKRNDWGTQGAERG